MERDPEPGQAFKRLKILDLRPNDDTKIPLGPEGLLHGVLPSGMKYYVRKNAKPKQRAALALAVRVGSVVEKEEERGVAHIVEHLAFSATKKYSNHEIVQFLESIGAEFGACSNAYTSADETVYELFVPIDKPLLLSQAISVLAEFSTHIRVADEDLEKERGAVLEEWRDRRNAAGRMQEAYWQLLMKGSQYADRQPIGLEKVIRTVPASTVLDFYRRWYAPERMALVAAGDFEDPQAVVALIEEHFNAAFSAPRPGLVAADEEAEFPVPPHEEPRFAVCSESEATQSAVMVSCKCEAKEWSTIETYREFLEEEMFHVVLNQRFFKISRRPDPPFYSCASGSESLVRSSTSYAMQASCREKGTLRALEAMLTEVARIRIHGISEREMAIVRKQYMADIESAYLERDQRDHRDVRDEYLMHFLRGEPVPGMEYEAQLAKTLIPELLPEAVARKASKYRLDHSCVVKTVEHRSRATEADLRAVAAKVQELESSGGITPWAEEEVPEHIVEKKPQPGSVLKRTVYSDIGITELELSNGMHVAYKCTDFLDDQVLVTGYAYGGLSEASQSDYHTCSMAATIAGEMGVFGHKPAVLNEVLAGKRAEVGSKVSAYMRTFSGDCSPADLETALELVYQLFHTRVEPDQGELAVIMHMTREAIRAQQRDPYTAYVNRVRELNYGNSYYFKPITVRELNRVDPKKACAYFDSCFRDPANFRVCIVGNFDPDTGVPLILQYLGGIRRPSEPIMGYQRDKLSPLPFKFPEGVVREEVRREMVEAQCATQITFPVQLGAASATEEVMWTGFLCKLLETKIMQVLRFKHGQVYTASVNAFLGGSAPSRAGSVQGDIAISFSCDPEAAWKLVELALEEVARLQEEGPTPEDVETVVELEQRAFETGLQENGFWLERIVRAYQSRLYLGDLGVALKAQEDTRLSVISAMTPVRVRDALRRILPVPCRERHTAVALLPRAPLWRRALSLPPKPRPGLTLESRILLGTAAAFVGGSILWRHWRQSSSE